MLSEVSQPLQSSSAVSTADPCLGRFTGRFSRQLETRSSNSDGSSGLLLEGAGGDTSHWARRSSPSVRHCAAGNGTRVETYTDAVAVFAREFP